jgi:hypothetical protein
MVSASATALAAGPMEQGTFAIGGERLMGVFHADAKNDPYPGQNPPGDEDGYTFVGLMGNGGLDTSDSRSMFMAPRIGLDYFIIDGLSLGGSLMVWSVGYNDANSPNDGSITNFLFAPRVGYAYMFGDVVGIWPRGGLSYVHGSVNPDPGGGNSSHYFAFNIDVPLIIAPVKTFAFTVGPIFDVTFGGSQTDRGRPVPEQTRDASLLLFGLSVGIVGLL